MGASSGWNLEMRRPPVRDVPTSAAHTVVRLARVPSGSARRGGGQHPRTRRQTLRAQAR